MSAELSPIDPVKNEVVAAMSAMFRYENTDGKMELSTFDPESPEGAAMLIEATIGELPDLSTLANMDIKVRHMLMHEASREIEGGEIETWQRIVVFDEKGQGYSCGSMGVKKCIEIMLRVRKAKLFDPPVLCKVKVKRLEGAKQWMTLEPNIESLLNKASKRK